MGQMNQLIGSGRNFSGFGGSGQYLHIVSTRFRKFVNLGGSCRVGYLYVIASWATNYAVLLNENWRSCSWTTLIKLLDNYTMNVFF